jgi:hypothetical protein
MKMKPVWTTAKREKIPYAKLTDSHLKNILKDGYRNLHLLREAARRKMTVPERAIDRLTEKEMYMWIESFSSCALAGNAWAEHMLHLWETDKAKFMLLLNKQLEKDAGR